MQDYDLDKEIARIQSDNSRARKKRALYEAYLSDLSKYENMALSVLIGSIGLFLASTSHVRLLFLGITLYGVALKKGEELCSRLYAKFKKTGNIKDEELKEVPPKKSSDFYKTVDVHRPKEIKIPTCIEPLTEEERSLKRIGEIIDEYYMRYELPSFAIDEDELKVVIGVLYEALKTKRCSAYLDNVLLKIIRFTFSRTLVDNRGEIILLDLLSSFDYLDDFFTQKDILYMKRTILKTKPPTKKITLKSES